MPVALTGDELLDLEIVSRRQETIRFELLNSANQLLGTVAVADNPAPSISNDGNATVPRTIKGLKISSVDTNAINPLTERIRPVWCVGPGGPGYEYNLGIFVFADDSSTITSWGPTRSVDLSDQMLLLSQPLANSVSYPAGTLISGALTSEAAAAGVLMTSIEPTGIKLGAPIVGLSGRDTRQGVVSKLCVAAGFLPAYFDNDGVFVCRSAPVLASATADHAYGAGTGRTGRTLSDSVHQSQGLCMAPNRYMARDTGLNSAEIVGFFDIPAAAPHSFANTGRYIIHSEDVQGLADNAAASRAAATLYAKDASVFASTTFQTAPDPRHDTFDIVSFDGVNYIEHVWRLGLSAGAPMDHDCRRIYQ